MSIVDFKQKRSGVQTEVSVDSSLSGVVYYHWYLNGDYAGVTTSKRRSFALLNSDEGEVDVLDTTDADFDPVANAPVRYSPYYTISWQRSLATNVEHYRIEQKKDSDDWVILERVRHDDAVWEYRIVTPRLVDLASYQWRIIPVDVVGNDGTAATLGPETVVRKPDAPEVTATFNDGDSKVTFAAV